MPSYHKATTLFRRIEEATMRRAAARAASMGPRPFRRGNGTNYNPCYGIR